MLKQRGLAPNSLLQVAFTAKSVCLNKAQNVNIHVAVAVSAHDCFAIIILCSWIAVGSY